MTPSQEQAIVAWLTSIGMAIRAPVELVIPALGGDSVGNYASIGWQLGRPGEEDTEYWNDMGGWSEKNFGWISLMAGHSDSDRWTEEYIKAIFSEGYSRTLNHLLNSQGYLLPGVILQDALHSGILAAAASTPEDSSTLAEMLTVLSADYIDMRFAGSAFGFDTTEQTFLTNAGVASGFGQWDRHGQVASSPAIGGFGIIGYSELMWMTYRKWKRSGGPKILPDRYYDNHMEDFQNYGRVPGVGKMTYIPIYSPKITYSSMAAAVSSVFLNYVPAVEMSQAIPYFNMTITSPGIPVATTAGTVTKPSISLHDYNAQAGSFVSAKGAIRIRDSLNLDGYYGEEHLVGQTDIQMGMELFNVPQTIVPAGAHRAGWSGSKARNIDGSRPFLTVQNFKVTVRPTRGSMSLQEATLQMTLHDRGALPAIAPLIKPEFRGRTVFTIEYGWSHPGGHPAVGGDGLTPQVYGQLIDSMRNRQTYSLVNSSYSFDPAGQVEITLKLIAQATNQINITDAAMTGETRQTWEAVELAFTALQASRSQVNLMDEQIADITGTSIISTLSLQATGDLIGEETLADVETWIAEASELSGGSGSLADLAEKVRIMKTAVSTASATLVGELGKKVDTLNLYRGRDVNDFAGSVAQTCPFTNYLQYGHGGTSGTATSFAVYNYVDNPYIKQGRSAKIVPLGALLQLFLVQPLATGGSYDEVQLVTFCANADAGAAAGCNLGALPVDIGDVGGKSFFEILKKKYQEYGGQLPIVRFFNWLMTNYVEAQFAAPYGLSNGASSSGKSGSSNYEVIDGEIKAKAQNDMGGVQAENERRLREFYYGSGAEGTRTNPKPVRFRPCQINIEFEVNEVTGREVIENIRSDQEGFAEDQMNDEAYLNAPYKILRLVVTDAAATSQSQSQEIARAFNNHRGTGVVDTSSSRDYYCGILPPLRDLFGAVKDDSIIDEFLAAGIITPVPEPLSSGNPTHATAALMAALVVEQAIAETDAAQAAFDELPNTQNFRLLEEAQEKEAEAKLEGDKGHSRFQLAASPKRLTEFLASRMPNILIGSAGSNVASYSIKTQNNSRNATILMQRALDDATGPAQPSRGMPMQVLPAQISMECMGNPSLRFMQQYFVNTQSGTNIDNIQVVVGLEHTITPSDFKTSIKFVPLDAYATFEGALGNMQGIADRIQDLSTTE